jgi:hypothetical protein
VVAISPESSSSFGAGAGGPLAPPGAAAALVSLAQDTFERAASHSTTPRVLLDPAAQTPLPASVAALSVPLVSLLPVMHNNDAAAAAALDPGGGGVGVGAGAGGGDGGDADATDGEGAEDAAAATAAAAAAEGPAKSNRNTAELKLELLRLLHALWSLHTAAGGGSAVGTGAPAAAAAPEAEHSGEEVVPPGVWRAEQADLIPLLAASHGATLSPSDRHAAALLLQLDQAAGGGGLAGLGYLWGEAAAYFVRTRAALRAAGAGGGGSAGVEGGEEEGEETAAPESVAAALRGGAPPDARRCAAAAMRFPHARPLPPPPPSLAVAAASAIAVLGEHNDNVAGGAAGTAAADEGIMSFGDGSGGPPSYAYDPAWVLPFTLHALRSGAMEPRECVAWGLLSLVGGRPHKNSVPKS